MESQTTTQKPTTQRGRSIQKIIRIFFKHPTVREFPNPIVYTRESWLAYMTSHSHDPLPSDPGYEAHMAEMDGIFDRENKDGLLRRDVVTTVYSERLE